MNNTFYFLRHAETKVDKDIPVSKWVLSASGEEQAKQRAAEGVFDDADIIFSSNEEKAYQTAKPIAEKLGKTIIRFSEINELHRDKGPFMKQEDYEDSIKYCSEHLSESINNWEMAGHALERFAKKIEGLDKQHNNLKILVVGHGFTINMYFAKLLNALDNVYARINTNTFADWGIIKNKKVIKDIAKQ